MTDSGFSLGDRRYPDTFVCPHIVGFVVFMAAAVAARRGGTNLDYTRECWDFMTEVVGRKLTIHDPLPADFDWTLASARECAEAMMEYDDD